MLGRWCWRRRWRRWRCRCGRGGLVVGKAAELANTPVDRIILAVAPDQRFVLLTEVESHAAPNTVEIVLPDLPFGKQRSHDAVGHRDAPFATERQRILTAEIA